MRCSPQEFRRRRIAEALNKIHNPDAIAYKLFPKNNPDSIIITPSNKSKIKSLKSSYEAAWVMVRKLDKELGKKYEFKTFGNWATVINGVDSHRVKITIPDNYMKAVIAKSNREGGQQSLVFEMPRHEKGQLPEKLNFSENLNFKKETLKRINKAYFTAVNLRKQNLRDTKLNKEIEELKELRGLLEQDIHNLISSDTEFMTNMESLYKDLTYIDRLLLNPIQSNLDTAEHIVSFIEQTVNLQIDSKNPMVRTDVKPSPQVVSAMKALREELEKRQDALAIQLKENFMGIVQSVPSMQKLMPNVNMTQLTQSRPDIDLISSMFLTLDKQLVTGDSLIPQLENITLEKSRSKTLSESSSINKKIDLATRDAVKHLPVAGAFLGLKERSYDWFYKKTSRGNKKSQLVTKYSSLWTEIMDRILEPINDEYSTAMAAADYTSSNKALLEKYGAITRHNNFLDLSLLPEIRANTKYSSETAGITDEQSQEYVEYLTKEFGKEHYNTIIKDQINELEDYESWKEHLISDALDREGITIDELNNSPEYTRLRMQLAGRITVNNPFLFMDSHKNGHNNEVAEGYFSLMSHNVYFPKKQISSWDDNTNKEIFVDSGYYDENFSKIESNPDLFNLWKVLDEALEYININLVDSQSHFVQGSILSMEKDLWETFMDSQKNVLRRGLMMASSLGKDLVSKMSPYKAKTKTFGNEQDINKSHFRTVEAKVNKRFRAIELKLQNLLKEDIMRELMATMSMPVELVNILHDNFGLPKNRLELKRIVGERVIPEDLIKEFIVNQIIEEQTFNLPLMVKGYVSLAAELKAQKTAQPVVSLLKKYYEEIEKTDAVGLGNRLYATAAEAMSRLTRKKSIEGIRVNALQRNNFWYDRNILGNPHHLSFDVTMGNVKGFVDLTVYDKYEKQIKKELNKIIADEESTPEEKKNAQEEIDKMGSNITGSAVINMVVNDVSMFAGLAWSFTAGFTNYYQGMHQGLVHDTGQFWTAGNWELSNSFVVRRGMSHLPGFSEYKKAVVKAKLMIDKMNSLQDATNEFDKAKNNVRGISGISKKFKPFYLTEVIEWNIQVPQILAILMDHKITDINGVTVPIFNGRDFHAFKVRDGLLELKPEFVKGKTLDYTGEDGVFHKGVEIDNQANWIDFSSDEAAYNKMYIGETIKTINGDYSKTGGTRIKRTPPGKFLMLFKNWYPNTAWVRYKKEHPNLILGKKDSKAMFSSHRPLTLGLKLGTFGVMYSPITGAIGLGAGMAIGAGIQWSQHKEIRFSIKGIGQMIEAIALKAGIPLNIITGKPIVKHHTSLSHVAMDEQDRQHLHSLLFELTVLLSAAVAKLAFTALWGDNDEPEPKSILNPAWTPSNGQKKRIPNKFYPGSPRTEAQKKLYNVLSNKFGSTLQDLMMYEYLPQTYETFLERNALKKFLDNLKSDVDAADDALQGLDYTEEGGSKVWKSLNNQFMPTIIKSPLTLGFESSMKKEFDSEEYFDRYFDTDYKKDKKLIESLRKELRNEIKKEIEDDIKAMDKKEKLSEGDKKMIRDYVHPKIGPRILDLDIPVPNRYEYDEKQKKISKESNNN